jgi:hypothetical protein
VFLEDWGMPKWVLSRLPTFRQQMLSFFEEHFYTFPLTFKTKTPFRTDTRYDMDYTEFDDEMLAAAQAAIGGLMTGMRRAANAAGVPADQVDELLGNIASLAPDPDALKPHDSE